MRRFYTITADDVNKSSVEAFGISWFVKDFIGQVLPRDVGKRIYLVDGPPESISVQVENDQQYKLRQSRQGFGWLYQKKLDKSAKV